MSTDMVPDDYWRWESERDMDERCSECGAKVKTQIMKGTGLCGELCRKAKAGETSGPRAQTDAGITNLLVQPGAVNPNGIR